MYNDANPKIRRLRKACLALPHVAEKEAWGECTFRVDGGTMFAMTDCNHHESGHIAVWVKAPYMVQEALVSSEPEIFFKPPYLGHKGWVGVRIDGGVDWKQLAELLADGHRLSLPSKLRVKAGKVEKRTTTGAKKAPVSKARAPKARSPKARAPKARAKRGA
jgi:hypothetical protein